MRCLVLFSALIAASASAQEYRPAYERTGGRLTEGGELVLVYIGQSTCTPCLAPAFKSALEQAKVGVAERAAEEGKAFYALGVALDWELEAGYDFLTASGAFDEVMIGRNWHNAGAFAHLYRAEGQDERLLALPTVMVFEREVEGEVWTRATGPRYRFEAAGSDALVEWVEAGLPLD